MRHVSIQRTLRHGVRLEDISKSNPLSAQPVDNSGEDVIPMSPRVSDFLCHPTRLIRCVQSRMLPGYLAGRKAVARWDIQCRILEEEISRA